MLKIRRSWYRLILNMGIPILVRRHLYIETTPCRLSNDDLYLFLRGGCHGVDRNDFKFFCWPGVSIQGCQLWLVALKCVSNWDNFRSCLTLFDQFVWLPLWKSQLLSLWQYARLKINVSSSYNADRIMLTWPLTLNCFQNINWCELFIFKWT